ncbi:hypothetical protein K502DRAFT_351126 [Neoconidiobolus thromboides FSU 785]|nr:hypothetical protein K502DRAFT_351126 [Neoconidiobolus thromboides FSU 785]
MSVNLQISSGIIYVEKRFDKGITLSSFKKRLEPITGISVSNQILNLYNGEQLVQIMTPFNGETEDSIMLGAFYVDDGYRVQVIDSSGSQKQQQYTDVNLVKKFELSNEEYEKRQDTVLAFKKRNQLGKFSEKEQEIKEEETEPKDMSVNQRCEIKNEEDSMAKRGTIKFIGKTQFKPGYWVGVELDEPYGKNNGSVNEVPYFECREKYGLFVKPYKVKVGDYPPFNIEDDLFDELDEI